MTGRIKIVGRQAVALSRRVRAAAKRKTVSVNAFSIEAFTQVTDAPLRVAPSKEAR